MAGPASKSTIVFAAAVALMSSVSTLAVAQAQNAGLTIGNNESILIDGKTFNIQQGSSKQDVSAQIKSLGAREVGPGAIIFRSGDKLYMVEATPIMRIATQHDRAYATWNPNTDCRNAFGVHDIDAECQRVYASRDVTWSASAPMDCATSTSSASALTACAISTCS